MKKWYETFNDDNNENDIVVSTRIRLARNIKNLPFKNTMSAEQKGELKKKVTAVLKTANLGENHFDFLQLDNIDEATSLSLVEKHLISRDFLADKEEKLLILSQDNSISIMVNEEDHIRIQVLSSGLDLQNAYNVCNELDNLTNEQLEYAFSPKLGFLTVCPTNLGTGLRASVMLHLKALEKVNNIGQLVKTIESFGLTIRGTFGEGTQATGSIYQLSNQVTLGLSEQTAIENLLNITNQIITAEKAARKELLIKDNSFEDEIFKSYGILKYARRLTTDEFNRYVSNIRVGISEGIITNVSSAKINKLYNMIYPATLCADNHKDYSTNERDSKRAEIVREALTYE